MEHENKICNNKTFPFKKDLVQGEDYYINEQGDWVFTAAYHLQLGYCCNSGCKHCPYGYLKMNKVETDICIIGAVLIYK